MTVFLRFWTHINWGYQAQKIAHKNRYIKRYRFYWLFKSRSHWKCTLGLHKHMILVCLYALFSSLLCFHDCTHVCIHLISNVHVVRTFKNRISFQTFEKWHNVSYRYVSYINSETSDIWRTGTWFLKFLEWGLRKTISTT